MKSIYTIKKNIEKRYQYAEFIKKLIAHEDNEEQKLLLIKYLLHYNCTHIMGRYSDGWLEQQIIQLGRRKVKFQKSQEQLLGTGLMVMTEVSSIGGHTALVNNWIQFDTSRRYSILLTDCHKDAVPDFLIESVKKSGGNIMFLHGKNDYIKADQLLRISQRFEKIILFTHMYDIIPVLSYSNENWNIPIYFYNHANFLFSIGLSVSDCFMTICDYDLIKAKKYRQAKNVVKLCIPAKTIAKQQELVSREKKDVKVEISKQYNIPKMKYLIVSMADDFKYKEIHGYDFKDFVEKLLDRAPKDTYFLIIGADKNNKRWKDLYVHTKGKGIALGRLERKEVSKILYASDAYVISFPMGAAGYDEAWEYGVPVFLLKVINRYINIFSEQICYDNINDMITHIVDTLYNPGKYKLNGIISERYHQKQQKWMQDLEEIFSINLEHEIHCFEGKKVISKEELINAQLLDGMNMYPFKEWEYLHKKYQCIIHLMEIE